MFLVLHILSIDKKLNRVTSLKRRINRVTCPTAITVQDSKSSNWHSDTHKVCATGACGFSGPGESSLDCRHSNGLNGATAISRSDKITRGRMYYAHAVALSLIDAKRILTDNIYLSRCSYAIIILRVHEHYLGGVGNLYFLF